MKSTKDLTAFLTAIFITSAVASLVLNVASMGPSAFDDIKLLVEMTYFVAIFAVPFVSFFAIFVALPIALFMRHQGYNSLLQLCVAGAVFGGLCILLTPLDFPSPVLGFATGVPPGLVAAIAWWLLVERHYVKASSVA